MVEFKYTFEEPEIAYQLTKKKGDSGYDLKAMKLTHRDEGFLECDFQIRLEIESPFYFKLYPRSSLFKNTGYILVNSVGIIDNSYRGNVKALLKKIGTGKEIEIGDRVCQLIVEKEIETVPIFSESLSETERGEGGFGSTGKN